MYGDVQVPPELLPNIQKQNFVSVKKRRFEVGVPVNLVLTFFVRQWELSV